MTYQITAFGVVFDELRRVRGETMKDWADGLGMTINELSMLRFGRMGMTPAIARRISEYLDTTPPKDRNPKSLSMLDRSVFVKVAESFRGNVAAIKLENKE